MKGESHHTMTTKHEISSRTFIYLVRIYDHIIKHIIDAQLGQYSSLTRV